MAHRLRAAGYGDLCSLVDLCAVLREEFGGHAEPEAHIEGRSRPFRRYCFLRALLFALACFFAFFAGFAFGQPVTLTGVDSWISAPF